MVGLGALVALIVQILWAVLITPVMIGVMRQARNRLEGRVGPGVMQPWRDAIKLFRKEPMRASGSDAILSVAPVILMVSSLMVCALVPLLTTRSLPWIPGDLFVVVSVLLIGTVALALLGLESGTAFGGMGSSREMMVAALVEPTVLVSVYALSIPANSSALGAIVASRREAPLSPVALLAIVALIVVVLAETGRLPIDNPSTHLELTMIHEAMVLENGGRDLGWIEFGSWLRLTALLGLIANLMVPWGIATSLTPLSLLIGIAIITLKVMVAALIVAVGEVFAAKLRLFRVPELLAASFVMAFLAVTASFVING